MNFNVGLTSVNMSTPSYYHKKGNKRKRNKNQEKSSYNDLLIMLEEDNNSRKDVYAELMKREESVLDKLSLAANSGKLSKEPKTNLFLDMSLSDIVARFAYTWQNIFNELVIEKRFNSLPIVLFERERKLHVGLMLLLVSIFLFMASS